ncbi:hypothetical protein KKE06_06060 [Candidatus Micrarchaeota archaeon]|nr:hypothetical protein [Candidatus Micrarchaeota archaeon]MBU1929887.1 hypothetical protein [Candidatus Micrarchaeota archaeon]
MFLEDQLALFAILFAISGIISTALLLEWQIPVPTTISELSTFPEQTKVVFKARILEWKSFQQKDRLELFDGNQVTAFLAKNQFPPTQFQNSIFEFKAQITKKKPTIQVRILEVNRLD